MNMERSSHATQRRSQVAKGSKGRVVCQDAEVCPPGPQPSGTDAAQSSDGSDRAIPDKAHTKRLKAAPILHEAVPLHQGKAPKIQVVTRGQTVWYRGDRYFVEFAPTSWDNGHYVRITDQPIRPNDPDRPLSDTRLTFQVHGGCLNLARPVSNIYAQLPSQAQERRAEVKAATGATDNGDEVAVILRSAATLDEVYKAAARFLCEGLPRVLVESTERNLRSKYGHLNPGMQRMNLGNKMRAELKSRRSER